jgi:hypothetical protein
MIQKKIVTSGTLFSRLRPNGPLLLFNALGAGVIMPDRLTPAT